MSFSTSRRTGEPNRRRANSRSNAATGLRRDPVDLEIGVAGDPERGMLDDPHAGEQLTQVGRDQFLEGGEHGVGGPSLLGRPRRRGGRRVGTGETLSGT